MLDQAGRLPDELIACVGGGSNAIGLFHPFLADSSVAMIGVEVDDVPVLPRLDCAVACAQPMTRRQLLHGTVDRQVSVAHWWFETRFPGTAL